MNRQRKRTPGESRPALYEHAFQERLATCGLTQRQQEVVELVIGGFTNREVAERLLIEEYTVKGHLRDIFERLNIHRRTALMTKILELTPPRSAGHRYPHPLTRLMHDEHCRSLQQ